MKQYRIIFTCLSNHAAQLEVVQSMEIDSFIRAPLGNVRLIMCDYGTNSVGVKSELQRALSEKD